MKILIAEDEALIAFRLKRICSELLSEPTIIIAHDVAGATSIMQDEPIDLLFLDLNLTGEDGFLLLKQAISYPFHTIVVSAYTDQAIKAFEYGVFDFIPKPFTKERISQSLVRMNDTEKPRINTTNLKYLGFKIKHTHEIKLLSDIMYIQASGNYGKAFFVSGSSQLHSKSLEELEKIIPPGSFIRIHRSILCNTVMIKKLHSFEGSIYKLELLNGLMLPVGRTRIRHIKALFQ